MSRIQDEVALRAIIGQPNKLTSAKIGDRLDDQAISFLSRAPFLLLATSSEDGTLEVSPKGDSGAVVHVADDRTLLLPERAGNNLAFGLTNILRNPNVGLICLCPGTGETLRVSGKATLDDDPALRERFSARGKAARLIIQISVERAYFHCARSVLRAGLWNAAQWPEPVQISFGRIIVAATKNDGGLISQIDDHVQEGYRTGL